MKMLLLVAALILTGCASVEAQKSMEPGPGRSNLTPPVLKTAEPRANPQFDCTAGCTFVCDAIATPPAGKPQLSKLYYSTSSTGQGPFTLKASGPPTTPTTGQNQCSVTTSFAAGNYSVVMSWVDSAGVEGPQSLPFVFESISKTPLPAPANVRIQ